MPRTVNGQLYYSIGEVAEIVGKSIQTIRLWDVWSDEREEEGQERFIPKPLRLTNRDVRYWNDEDIAQIQEFSDSIRYGSLSKYNRRRWGERGKNIKVDKSLEHRYAEMV